MKRVYCTFSGKAYDETTALIVKDAPRFGADEVRIYDDRWLVESGYVARNPWLYEPAVNAEGFEYKFGFGWCSWKAFVILSAMETLEDGDIVLYTDADTWPVAPFGVLYDLCAESGGVFLFTEHGCSTLRFTKADCFLAMGMPIAEAPHSCGRFSLWQKGPFLVKQMLAEWWAYSINPRCMRWDRSILQEDQPEYFRNSTEQSVLTNLATKYGIPVHRNPDQSGIAQGGDERYGQLFEQRYCTGDRTNTSGSSYRNIKE